MDKLLEHVFAFFEQLRQAGAVLSFFAGVAATYMLVWRYRLIPKHDAEKELEKRNDELVKKNEAKDEQNRTLILKISTLELTLEVRERWIEELDEKLRDNQEVRRKSGVAATAISANVGDFDGEPADATEGGQSKNYYDDDWSRD